MTSIVQHALGDRWHQLPSALRAHYMPGRTADIGLLDVEFPVYMQPLLFFLASLGILVRRRGIDVQTHVEKMTVGARQHWQRTLRFPDGTTHRFDTVWEQAPNGHVVEYVNAWLGLQMLPFVVGQELHYRGVRLLVRFGNCRLQIPEWLALGHTTIVERALDERRFEMDFRLTHPLFGQVFRYSGTFEANVK